MEDWNNFKQDIESIISHINSIDDPIRKKNITDNFNNLLYSWKNDLMNISDISNKEDKDDMENRAIEKAIIPLVIYMKLMLSNYQN